MWSKATLLAMTLTLALPAFADPAPKAHGTQQIKKPKPASIPIDSFAYGGGGSLMPKGNGTSPGKANPGAVTATNRCKKPNPPHDCKQPNPRH